MPKDRTAGENINADKVFHFNGIVLGDIYRVVQGRETRGRRWFIHDLDHVAPKDSNGMIE